MKSFVESVPAEDAVAQEPLDHFPLFAAGPSSARLVHSPPRQQVVGPAWQNPRFDRDTLKEAVISGRLEAVRLLADLGEGVHVRDEHGATSLHWAASKGQVPHIGTAGLFHKRYCWLG